MKIRDIEVFQVSWSPADKPEQRSAWVRVYCDNGLFGIGEASPMQGGLASLGIITRNLAPVLVGRDPLDHAVLFDGLLHTFAKLGPEGALTGALAALDIALWDIKGKFLNQPIYNRTKPDIDIPGDIAKARAVRQLVGDGFPLAFDANNGYSVGGAIRVGRALEELGYWWFEEPVQHYHEKAMGEVARKLDITVSAGEQTYTLAGLADLITAGVRMVQPDIVKMGGITGLIRCIALAHAHGVELVPHQTQPTIGHMANLHLAASQLHATKPCELNDSSARQHGVFENPPKPVDGLFHLHAEPGLGLRVNEAELTKRRMPIA